MAATYYPAWTVNRTKTRNVTMNSENRVQWVYASESNQQLEERYDQWAKEYDEDLESDFGYVIPRIAAETFQQFVPRESRVLDAGAGTGLVGVELHRLRIRQPGCDGYVPGHAG